MKKLIILIVTIAVCIGICINLRGNRRETTFKKVYDSYNQIDYSFAISAFGKTRDSRVMDYIDISTYDELKNKSKIIADVEFISRKQLYGVIETKVKVKKLYKGHCDKIITIYEAGFVGENYNAVVIIQSKPLMNNKNRYLVFLQESIPENGRYYTFVNTILGSYPRSNDMKKIVVNEKDGEAIVKKKDLDDVELVQVHYSKETIEGEEKQDSEGIYNKTLSLYETFKKKALSEYQ